MAKGKLPEGPPLQDGDADPFVSMQQERLIGRLIAAWSRLEGVMQDTIWTLLNVDSEDGQILTARADANRKIQWIRALAKRHLSGDRQATLLQVMSTIDELKDDRNFVAHGTWFTARTASGSVAAAASNREKTDPGTVVVETFTPDRMRAITQRIDMTKIVLMKWTEEHIASRGQSPSTPDG